MAAQHTHIEAGEPRKFWEFIKFRQLVYFFTWREFKVRYKQTFFGILWAIVQPLLFAGIIGIVITRRAGLSFGYEQASDLVVIFLGFSLWQYFQGTFGGSVNSIAGNKPLIKKIYFPKLILIFSSIASRTVDFGLQMLVFIIFLLVTGSAFSWLGLLWLIPSLILLSSATFAIALILAPLNVKFRDIGIVLPFLIRIMFFTTPIWYPFSIIPENLQQILLFNPPVAVLEFVRSAIFDPINMNYALLLYPIFTISALLAIGIPFFKHKEGSLADYM